MSTQSSQTSPSPLLFLIVGRNEPLYEAELHKTMTAAPNTTSSEYYSDKQQKASSSSSDSITRQNYFVLHSALDLVDINAWTNSNMYLRVVDKVNHQMVSVFVTASHVKFMLLHNSGGKNNMEDMVRNFFMEVYEVYVKLSMNPFYKYDTAITSKAFDAKVHAAGRRYLLQK